MYYVKEIGTTLYSMLAVGWVGWACWLFLEWMAGIK